MADLQSQDIKIGSTYRAKRPQKHWSGTGFRNDRVVIWLDATRSQVQYDSDTVAIGRRLPIVTMEAFLKWAKHEVDVEAEQQNIPTVTPDPVVAVTNTELKSGTA